jgi:hypothetical protein
VRVIEEGGDRVGNEGNAIELQRSFSKVFYVRE